MFTSAHAHRAPMRNGVQRQLDAGFGLVSVISIFG
jgi:hypothetical protein